jgi:photosystem II stability/assembly factor-like uncharacterized protein
VSITVKPGDTRHMLVASETGGLFRTSDGGNNRQHLSSLPSYQVHDLAYAHSNPDIVIAVSLAAYKHNNGPIWRSTYGGNTWSQPAGSIPPSGSRCGDCVSAYSVSFDPGIHYVVLST